MSFTENAPEVADNRVVRPGELVVLTDDASLRCCCCAQLLGSSWSQKEDDIISLRTIVEVVKNVELYLTDLSATFHVHLCQMLSCR